MAKKDDDTVEKTAAEDVKAEKATPESTQKATVAAANAQKTPPWPLITIGVVGTVLVLALGAFWWLQLVSLHKTESRTSSSRYGQMERPQFGGGSENGRSDMPNRRGFSRAVATGVVTAINGNTITVAGGGKQVTVKKTDSTVISGDESDLAVNDTVLVYGTAASDGTVTATRIVVRNSSLLNDSAGGDGSPSI